MSRAISTTRLFQSEFIGQNRLHTEREKSLPRRVFLFLRVKEKHRITFGAFPLLRIADGLLHEHIAFALWARLGRGNKSGRIHGRVKIWTVLMSASLKEAP